MHYLQALIDWLQLNPDYALFITFLMAFAESLIFVGGLIPGSLAITGIGILAGSGVIPIFSTLLASIFGAICGDAASFFIGRYFNTNLRNFFVFKKYPKTLAYGEFYFEQHGGKSVFLARFIGPIRAIMPAIAGMMGMPIINFILANSLSAIGWSILFFYPGVFIGRGHEQIKEHFEQIIIATLVLIIIPLICLKLWQFIHKKYQLVLTERFNLFWRQCLNRIKLLNLISPKPQITSYASTAFECLLLMTLILCSIFNAWHPIYFIEMAWLQHPPLLSYLFTHIAHMNNYLHLVLILIFFGIYTLVHHKFRWLASALLVVILGFFVNSFLLEPKVFPFPQEFTAMTVFSISLGLQYLCLRTLIHHKTHGNHVLILGLWLAWCINAYLLSMYFQKPSSVFFINGLLIGQIAWLHARFIDFSIDKNKLWYALLFTEMIIAWIK